MPISATLVRRLSEMGDSEFREMFLLLVEEMERQWEQLAQQVTKEEFRGLQEVVEGLVISVRELAEAQKRTEERINELAEAQKRAEERLTRLEVTVAELAEAQKRAEERLTRLESTVAELIEAQKRTEERLTRLEATVAELAEAQKRTEERVNELAEAQKRTEKRLNELAEAQKRTEEQISKLVEAQRRTEERVDSLAERLEGISHSVGYSLENRAFKALPALLRGQGIQVEGRLLRRYVQIDGRERQVNIYGHGRREGERVLIVGEAKVRPSRREIDRFLRLARRLGEQEGLPVFPLFVAHDFPPAIEAYLRERGIWPVWSYDLE